MDLYDVMRSTPAVREFTDEPLPDETLRRILDHARFAPSGGNRQGTRIVVVRDPETRARLAELNKPAVRRYVAQTRAGQSPWNPLEPPLPSADDIAATGATLSRSEGLGVASLRLFESGALSADPADPLRADALPNVEAATIAEAFQVTDDNPLVGLEGRAALLRRVGGFGPQRGSGRRDRCG